MSASAKVIDMAAWREEHRPVRAQVALPLQAWIDAERCWAAWATAWWIACMGARIRD